MTTLTTYEPAPKSVTVTEHVAELERALDAEELVVVCWEPGCDMHRLPHWAEAEWVSHPRRPGYRMYSHGICRFEKGANLFIQFLLHFKPPYPNLNA